MTPSQPASPAAGAIGFADLALSAPIQQAIAETGYTAPTPIQVQAIPLILAGGDLMAAAQTGTGKTAGFTLPILHLLSEAHAHNQQPGRPRCLILAPTRELAAQVEESVQIYGKHLPLTSMVMFGGVAINPQINRLKARIDILVATPGRLLDHHQQGTIDLSGVDILVLDEADRMLDMGFIRDIKKILAMLPKQRQNLLFSATFSDEIKALADGLLHNPGYVEVARRNTASELVQQSVHICPQKQKRELLAFLIKKHQWFQVLVFTRTKHGANKLAEYLARHDIPCAAIHGNKSQSARTRALADFKDAKLQVLVATDIAARGLDIDQLPQVVNFDLPNVPEDYVHRIGRTGRAGSAGAAVSLVDKEELPLLKDVERFIKRLIDKVDVPDFVPTAPAEPEVRDPADRPQPKLAPQGKRGQGQGQGHAQGQASQKPGEGKFQGKPKGQHGNTQGQPKGQGSQGGQGAQQGQGKPFGKGGNAASQHGKPRPPQQQSNKAPDNRPKQPGQQPARRSDSAVDDDFGNRVDYKPRARGEYRDPEAKMTGHRQGNFKGGNPNRGTPAALEESRRTPVTLTGRRVGEVKPSGGFNRGGGNGNR